MANYDVQAAKDFILNCLSRIKEQAEDQPYHEKANICQLTSTISIASFEGIACKTLQVEGENITHASNC